MKCRTYKISALVLHRVQMNIYIHEILHYMQNKDATIHWLYTLQNFLNVLIHLNLHKLKYTENNLNKLCKQRRSLMNDYFQTFCPLCTLRAVNLHPCSEPKGMSETGSSCTNVGAGLPLPWEAFVKMSGFKSERVSEVNSVFVWATTQFTSWNFRDTEIVLSSQSLFSNGSDKCSNKKTSTKASYANLKRSWRVQCFIVCGGEGIETPLL